MTPPEGSPLKGPYITYITFCDNEPVGPEAVFAALVRALWAIDFNVTTGTLPTQHGHVRR